MKLVKIALILLVLVGCSQKTKVTELNHDELMAGDFSSIVGKYKNEVGDILIIDREGMYDNKYFPKDGSTPWTSVGSLIYLGDNLFISKPDFDVFEELYSTEYFPAETESPIWYIYEDSKLYGFDICRIKEYFGQENEIGSCMLGPDGGVAQEEHYPTKSQLIEFRNYFLENIDKYQKIELKKEEK